MHAMYYLCSTFSIGNVFLNIMRSLHNLHVSTIIINYSRHSFDTYDNDCAYTHTETRTRLHTDARTRTRTPARTPTHIHARTHTCTHAHTHVHTHTRTYIRTHIHTHTHAHAHTRTYTNDVIKGCKIVCNLY